MKAAYKDITNSQIDDSCKQLLDHLASELAKEYVCGGEAVEAVAPAVNRLFAGSRYGISVWGMYLFQRFAMHQTVGGFGRMSEAFGLLMKQSANINQNTNEENDSACVLQFTPATAQKVNARRA